MSTPRHLILGTAGHIDHGKTSLVRALTGTDTDRLPEEKRRGITIELGFAELGLGDVVFGVVDVPGHERFVRTMVAGATGIDLALLVVAADDSVMPQTVEHAEILALLGIRRGVVAVTKADLADADMIALVREEADELLKRCGLPDWPAVAVSSTTGQGLDDLRAALAAVAADIAPRADSGLFRMAIDRVFTRPGRGTVVTGSVLRGRAAIGDALELLPKGLAVKVRDAQSHGRETALIGGGQRAALNLSGVDRDQIAPGDELATPGYLTPAQIIDAEVTFVSSLARAMRPMSRVRFASGTREVVARYVPYEGIKGPRDQGTEGNEAALAQIAIVGCPTLLGWGTDRGAATLAQFRLAEPVVVEYGQRFILREENASRTLGGGRVLRFGSRRMRRTFLSSADALEAMRHGDSASRLEAALRIAAFEPTTDLALAAATGIAPGDIPAVRKALGGAGRLILPAAGFAPVPAATLDALSSRSESWLDRYHSLRPDEPGCPIDRFLGWVESKSKKGLGRALLDRMIGQKRVKVVGRFVCLPSFAPALSAQDEKLLADLLAELETAAFQPPAPGQTRVAKAADPRRLERLLKIAVAHGAIVRIDADIYLAAAVEGKLRDVVRAMVAGNQEVSVATVREKLNSSRKYVVPFLEHLDKAGFTRRVGDTRVLTEQPINVENR